MKIYIIGTKDKFLDAQEYKGHGPEGNRKDRVEAETFVGIEFQEIP